jgi:diguanylate cyclase (GGDEF)-like protein
MAVNTSIAAPPPRNARAAHVTARRRQLMAYVRRKAKVRIHPEHSSEERSGDRLPWWRKQLVWQLAAAGAVGSYAISLATVHRPASGYNSFWDGWMCSAAIFLPIIPIVLRAWASPRVRSAWLFLGAGILLYNVGNAVYLFHDQNLNPIPNPAPSDVFYLLEYVALGIGVVLFTQRNFGAVRASTRLDGAITGLAIAATSGLVWFDHVLKASGRPLQVVVGMAYPIMDLVLLVLLIAAFAPMRYRPTRPVMLLMLGVTAFVIGDVVYLNQIADNTYIQGTLLDASWAVGIWIMGLAAWPRDVEPAAVAEEGSGVPKGITSVPVAFGSLSVLVLVVSLVHHTSRVTSLLALGALVLVIVRMAITLREVLDVERSNFRTARVDELTGLGNRRAFFELGVEMLDSLAPDARLGIVLVDLDGFKEINDSLGHACGDELLRVISRRFEIAYRHRGTTSRIGGDEFAFTFNVASIEELVAIGDGMAVMLSESISIDGMSVRVSASIGIAASPDHGTTLTDLLRCADVAMYKAKESHTMVRLYQPEDDVHTREQLMIIDDLRTAPWERDLVLHYQPTLDLVTGEICGVEALVRWRHERFGLLYPNDFIPLAERTGLVHALTRAVLGEAIAELRRLDDAGHQISMSVNISRLDLLDDELPSFVGDLLARHGVPSRRLTLEITETSLGEEPEHASRSIEQLRELGVRISIDDFGVGYSSMSQLLELTVDELKIDKSFVFALRTDLRARAVISAAIMFARALQLTVVAEGIETFPTLHVVQRLGVDVGQGYFISVPLAAAQLHDFLAAPPEVLPPARQRRAEPEHHEFAPSMRGGFADLSSP